MSPTDTLRNSKAGQAGQVTLQSPTWWHLFNNLPLWGISTALNLALLQLPYLRDQICQERPNTFSFTKTSLPRQDVWDENPRSVNTPGQTFAVTYPRPLFIRKEHYQTTVGSKAKWTLSQVTVCSPSLCGSPTHHLLLPRCSPMWFHGLLS